MQLEKKGPLTMKSVPKHLEIFESCLWGSQKVRVTKVSFGMTWSQQEPNQAKIPFQKANENCHLSLLFSGRVNQGPSFYHFSL